MSTAIRPSPLSFDSGRQSPFRRQNSVSPAATVRATTPTQSPTKALSSLSPSKASPFVRQSSQISQTSDRPSSPFARPSGRSLNVPPSSPSRATSNACKGSDEDNVLRSSSSRSASVVSPTVEEEATASPTKLQPSPSPSPSPFDGPAWDSPTSQTPLRPTTHRTLTSSTTTSTIKPLTLTTTTTPTYNRNNAFTHVPPPLLRSMRESFEVLDSTNTGAITPASLAPTLSQLGLDTSSSSLTSLHAFFPPSTKSTQPQPLNLSRYLDILSAPLSQLSSTDELLAAFEAFDVDDSGQIDVVVLRNAILNTGPEPAEEEMMMGHRRLAERDVDAVLGEFAARRAFGAKGVNVAKGRREVFRYRDFMACVFGGAAGGVAEEAAVVA